MKLSTFQIILLAVFGAFALGGLLIFALATASGGASATGPVVIWGTLDETAFRSVISGATETDSNFGQVTYVKKDPSDYDQQLKDALASGRGPDLYIMSDDHAIRDANFSLHVPYEKFSKAQFDSTFIDAALAFTGDDGVIAVPFAVDPLVLFWNKDALGSAGISSPPQYWDQVPGMVEKLVKKNESGNVVKGGIALGQYTNIKSAKDILATLIMQAGGNVTIRDQDGALRPALASQKGAKLATQALDFYTEFADPSQPDYSWSKAFPDARAAFAAADVAMYIGHASDFKGIVSTNPNLNFAMAPMPQLRSGQYALNISDVYAVALARNSQNTGGALTIAYTLAGQELSTKLATALGMGSAMRRVISPSEETAQPTTQAGQALQKLVSAAPKTAESLLNFEAGISRAWLDPDPEQTDALFRDMIENTVSGAMNTAEAVARGEKQLNAIIGQ